MTWERAKQINWAQWCRVAARAKFYCQHCRWPLDHAGPEPPLLESCQVCSELLRVIRVSGYFNNLDKEDARKRKDMGIQD